MEHLILGLVQGLTEFLPVSSSGHLVIFTKLFNLPTDLFFDALVHIATALAAALYFWKDISKLIAGFFSGLLMALKVRSVKKAYYESPYFKLSCLLLIATFATAVIGLSFKDYFEGWFDSLSAVGYFLLLTGGVLFLAERFGNPTKKEKDFTRMDALLIGFAQGAAIAPGFSRSGSTISMALLRDLDRGLAARFSFILALPAILGAALIEAKPLLASGIGAIPIVSYSAGFIAAFVSGFIAIKIFMDLIQRSSLKWFAYYCFSLGILVLVWALY